MTDLVPVESTEKRPQLFDMKPAAMVANATEVANVLSDVIKKQGLSQSIQGREYVKCDGWAAMGSMLGILPKESKVIQLEDGSFEAYVDLINMRTGMVVGCGSAICSVTEKKWGNSPLYARRSMAITRATGKAFRLGLSWIMTLAGYQATPAEELMDLEIIDTKPAAFTPGKFYQDTDDYKKLLMAEAKKQGFDMRKKDHVGLIKDVHTLLVGKPMDELPAILADAVKEKDNEQS